MIAGKYNTKGKLMGKMMDCLVDFQENGDIITGTMEVMGTVAEIADGKAKGNKFTGKFDVPTPMGQLKLNCEGKVTGDNITFTIANVVMKAKFDGMRIHE